MYDIEYLISVNRVKIWIQYFLIYFSNATKLKIPSVKYHIIDKNLRFYTGELKIKIKIISLLHKCLKFENLNLQANWNEFPSL